MNKTQCKYNNRIFRTIYFGDCCIKRENILLDNDAGFFFSSSYGLANRSDILFPIYLGLSPYLLSLCNLSLYPDCDSRLIVKIFYQVYTTKGVVYMFICCKT